MKKFLSIFLIIACAEGTAACAKKNEANSNIKQEKTAIHIENSKEVNNGDSIDDNIIKFESEEIDFSNIKYKVSEADRDAKLEEVIIKTFNYNKETDGPLQYYYNKIDLNGDETPETFVFLAGPYVSGSGGSTALVFEGSEDNYKLVTRFTLVRNPIIVSESKTNRWNDLIMHVSGGGIEPFYSEIKFDGNKYPSNPSVQPKIETGAEIKGTAIIADDMMKKSGIEIN